MKSIIRYLLLSIIMFVFNYTNAQVTVSGSGGSANGTYTSLKGAFDSLNLVLIQTGNNITVTINSASYFGGTETASCILKQPSVFSWESLTITPVGAVTVSGAMPEGNSLIDLNGADNVFINGLNSGGNSLTISNTTASEVAGTSTIYFHSDAFRNKITNCTVLGSSSMAANINGGTIYFGADAISTGNDSNTISNCNIGPAGSNLPSKAIFGNGTSTYKPLFNSGNIITGCKIYDYFSSTVQSAGIYLSAGNTNWAFTNNKFYQTSGRTQKTGSIHSMIQLASTNVFRCLISGNVFGFSSGEGTGTYEITGISSMSRFYPIYISNHGSDSATSIQGNVISNIKFSGNVSGIDTLCPFAGILASTGLSFIGNITGNVIGSSGTSGSIIFTSSGTSRGEFYGIYHADSSTSSKTCNNFIGGITGNNTSSGELIMTGIRTSTRHRDTILNNKIGFPGAGIENNSVSTHSRLTGIYSNAAGSIVTKNTITNLKTVSPNTGKGTFSSLIGIWLDNSDSIRGNNISMNKITALVNTNSTSAVSVTGLAYNGANIGTHLVTGNIIHSLSIYTVNPLAVLNGIFIENGVTSYQNNFVSLGIDAEGNSITQNIAINGINETTSGSDNFYFNSVYIGGSGVIAGNVRTFALNSAIKFKTRSYRANIFYNARSNGSGTGIHYAVKVEGSAGNTSGLLIFNNLYYASGSGGRLGYFGQSTISTLEDWQNPLIGPGQDYNSYYADPQFKEPAISYKINLDTNSTANNNAKSFIGSEPVDIEGNPRNHFRPDLGAYEFTGTYIFKLNVSLQDCPADSIKVSFVDEMLCIPVSVKTIKITGEGPYYFRIIGLEDIIPASAPIFFLEVQQKSSLKIWSNNALGFAADCSGEFDFTTLQTKEYSSNLVFNGIYWTMIGGDVNQDDIIDYTDLAGVNDDANNQVPGSASGFTGTDINCDGYTDADDQAVVDNNSAFIPQEVPPCP